MSKKNVMIMMLAMMLVCVISVGGTIAWLTSTTETVTNTFTVGEVKITLDEGIVYTLEEIEASETDNLTDDKLGQFKDRENNRGNSNVYQIIPDNHYRKDPIVTVTDESEDCYLFVEFTEPAAAQTYFTYTSTLTTVDGWTQGSGTIPANVWYREVLKDAETKEWQLLKTLQDAEGNDYEIAVRTDVTNENMDAAKAVELSWKAYAIQLANIDDAETAWGYVSTAANGN